MYALFINISVRNWYFTTEEGLAMRFPIEPVYWMTWIWTFHRAHNILKSPIKEDNIWANMYHYHSLHFCLVQLPFHMTSLNYSCVGGLNNPTFWVPGW